MPIFKTKVSFFRLIGFIVIIMTFFVLFESSKNYKLNMCAMTKTEFFSTANDSPCLANHQDWEFYARVDGLSIPMYNKKNSFIGLPSLIWMIVISGTILSVLFLFFSKTTKSLLKGPYPYSIMITLISPLLIILLDLHYTQSYYDSYLFINKIYWFKFLVFIGLFITFRENVKNILLLLIILIVSYCLPELFLFEIRQYSFGAIGEPPNGIVNYSGLTIFPAVETVWYFPLIGKLFLIYLNRFLIIIYLLFIPKILLGLVNNYK